MPEDKDLPVMADTLDEAVNAAKKQLLAVASAHAAAQSHAEIEDWRRNVDDLRADVDRLIFAQQNLPKGARRPGTTTVTTYSRA